MLACIRAALFDMKSELYMNQWDQSASDSMGHVLLTDRHFLYGHLMSPQPVAIEDTRLAIDLMALRQQIWNLDGERKLEVDSTCVDHQCWIDTGLI